MTLTSGAMRAALNNAMDLMAILDERGQQVAQRAAKAIQAEKENGLSDEGVKRLTNALLECCVYQRQAEGCARLVCSDLDELARMMHHRETHREVLA
jgi:hypothetical protein